MENKELITEEAKRLLEEESMRLAQELEQEAIGEALWSRGKPIEVTASDVRKARVRFIKREQPFLPMTDLLLRVYAVLGVLMFGGGIFYPFIKPLFEQPDPVLRMSLYIAATGLVLILSSVFGRYYLKLRYEARVRQQFDAYEQDRRDRKAEF